MTTAWMLIAFLAAPAGSVAQAVQQNWILMVSGQAGQVPVLQLNGRSYVDIDALARLTNGLLSFKGTQITLTLPASPASALTTATPSGQPANPGFSKDFLKAGIEAMTVIREWRGALVNAVKNGYPVTDEFVAGYQGQASTNLRLANLAVTTDSDRSAVQLLSNELDNMQKLSNKILAERQNLNYLSPDALKDDPLNQKILTCAHSLASMAASDQFQDDGSCH
jgi:hypothetical protein